MRRRYSMEFKDNEAIYLQIADLICENIIRKRWHVDEKIPSVRQLAIELEVNPNTVMRTFTFLQDNEIIYNKRGIGFYVSLQGIELARKMIKRKFIRNELPHFFKMLDLLDISIEEVINLNKPE